MIVLLHIDLFFNSNTIYLSYTVNATTRRDDESNIVGVVGVAQV